MPHYVLDARTATPHFPGIGRYVRNLAGALIPLLQTDEKLTILHHPDHPLALPASNRAGNLPATFTPFSLAQQWAGPRLLRRLGATLYHSAYYLMPCWPGVPALLTVYDLIPLLYPAQSSVRARLLFGWATALALRASHHIISISAATSRDYVARFALPLQRLTTIPLAADPAFLPQPKDAVDRVRARYCLPPRYVLYLGSNKPHKNLVCLVEAWDIAETRRRGLDIRLVIAGYWDPRYPEARRRVGERNLEASVLFAGPVLEADLPALYSGATCFVFPSLYEGFGLPVLEAMACGAPVISSDASSLPEVAGSAAILVDPTDVQALAAAIDQGLSDESLRQELRDKGLKQARRFDWHQTAQQTLDLYRCHAASPSQARRNRDAD